MYGGVIENNKATNGAGVYLYGESQDSGITFYMYGGSTKNKIVENSDVGPGLGGGVYVRNGTFTMTSGVISGNTGTANSGVFLEFWEKAHFDMQGGSIINNIASQGVAALSAGAGHDIKICGNVNITGNSCTGLDHESNVTVASGQKLKYGEDYEIVLGSYKKNIKKGTGRVTIRGLGKYEGTKLIKFKIVRKKL